MPNIKINLKNGGQLKPLYTQSEMDSAKSGIHIKPENRGKFNATKKATGKTTEQLTHSKNPVTRKRAIFAQNAAKWKHEDGGQLPVEGPGPKKPMPKRAAAKKPYDLDSEIPSVLKAKSSFDSDSTFQDLIKTASKQTGVDSKLLFASSLQEGMNKAALRPDEISEAYRDAGKKNSKLNDFPVDGFYNYGLDRFGEMAPELLKKGYISKDLEYSVFDAKNENKEPIKTAAFRNNQDALIAKAAVLKNEKDKVMSYAKKKGIALTPETENYFVLASYNGGMGNAQKMMDEYQQQGAKGTDFITKDQTTRKGVSKNVIPRYNRINKVKSFFEHGGEIKKLNQLTDFSNKIAEGGITMPDYTQADQEINNQFQQANKPLQKWSLAKPASFDSRHNISTPNLTAGDQETKRNFDLRPELQQVQRQQRDLSIKAATAPSLGNINGKAPAINPLKEKEQYTGLNPFTVGLTMADMLIPREPTPRRYTRPEDTPYYNPFPQGTGSQAIMKDGGKIYVSGSGISYDEGGVVGPGDIDVAQAQSLEADRSPDAMQLSKRGQELAFQNALLEKKREEAAKLGITPNPNLPLQQGSYNKDGDWVPNQNYTKPGRVGFIGVQNSPVTTQAKKAALDQQKMMTIRYANGGEIMNVSDLDNRIAEAGSRMTSAYEQGGELQLFDPSTGAHPISRNMAGNPIVEFKGPSHEERNDVGSKGIPMSFQGQQVEVEGGETGFKDTEGNFNIMGNLKNPLTGRLFKNDGKILAKEENKAMKQLSKGMDMVETYNINDPFERLKYNTGKAKMKGGKTKLNDITKLKDAMAEIQNQKLAMAKDLGIEPLALDKGKYGKMLKAEGGFATDYSNIDPVTGGRKKVTRDSKTTSKPTKEVLPPVDLRPKPPVDQVAPTGDWDLVMAQEPLKPWTDKELVKPEQPKGGDVGTLYNPYKEIGSDAEGFDPTNLIGEMYSIASNRVQPVQMQKYNPALAQSYDVSFQDRINQNTSSFRAAVQQAQGNPAALATLAGQKYAADTSVMADEFRTNQGLDYEVYNQNRATMNDAQLKNIGLQDQQYVRQTEARTNTDRRTLEALSSISNKFLKHKASQNELRVMENLYDYRFDPKYRARYEGAQENWATPLVAGVDPASTKAAQVEAAVKKAKDKKTTGKYGLNINRQYKLHK